MDSIRDLYLKIKESDNINEKNQLLEQFNESVNDSFTNKQKYILNHPYLEYIVSSKNGLELFEQFLEKYGLPIESFDRIHKIIETKKNSLDPSKSEFKDPQNEFMYEKYSSILEKLNQFRSKWSNAFIMFENTKCDLNYTEIYYEYAINKKPNTNKLLSRYGSSIIPDLIIFNKEFCSNDDVLKPITENTLFFNESNAQWMFESMKPYSKDSSVYQTVCMASFDKKLCNLMRREKNHFIESVLMCDFNSDDCFIEEDIKLIDGYIKFKKSIDRSKLSDDEKVLIEHQIDKALTLKDELEDSANIMTDFLQNVVTEGLWSQSNDKKPGKIPDYIKHNYDIDDDEDFDEKPRSKKQAKTYDNEDEFEDDEENEMNTYKRHPTDDNLDYSDDFHSPEKQSTSTSDGKQINYYYYNYNNSFNRHRNDYSHHGSYEYYGGKQPKRSDRRDIEESILYSIPDRYSLYTEHTNVFDLEAYFFLKQI